MKPQKILYITRNFPPMVGGMERLSSELVQSLSGKRRCVMIGPSDSGKHAPSSVMVHECPTSPIFLFFSCAILKSAFGAWRSRPDIVLAGSGAMAPVARVAATIASCPYAVLVHGLDLVVNNRFYKRYFLPSIVSADLIIANSKNTRRIAVEYGVVPDKSFVVWPGVSEPVKKYRDFRQAYSLGQRPMILFLGRLVPRKGLVEFIKNSLSEIVKRIPDAVFVIVGAEPKHALKHKNGVLAEVIDVSKELNLERNIIYAGNLPDEQVEGAYRAADAFVFPVKQTLGDVEGFGMVALEAAIRGLPTVAFRIDGVPDAVSEGNSGYLIEPGDYTAMANCLCQLLLSRDSSSTLSESCVEFARGFSWERYGNEVLRALDRCIHFN